MKSPSKSLSYLQSLRYRISVGMLRVLAYLPRSIIDRLLVPILQGILYHLIKYRRTVVDENLRLTLTSLSARERKDIARRFYHHLAELILHEASYAYGSHEQVQRLFRLEHTELLDQLYDRGCRQLFVLLGHIGPWELMASSALHLDATKYQVYVIYKQLGDPVANQLTLAMRERHYAHGIEMTQLARILLRHRMDSDKEHMQIYCLLADQSPEYERMRYTTTLFGRTTPFVMGWSHLATKLQIPLLFYEISYDELSEEWVGTFMPLCDQPKPDLCYQLIDDYASRLEDNIRLAPHRWLWSHKRWRYDPHDFPQMVYSDRCSNDSR